jgi:hypothetical protein
MESISTARQLLKYKADTLRDEEVAEVLEYIAIMKSLDEQTSKRNPFDEAMLKLLHATITGSPVRASSLLKNRSV